MQNKITYLRWLSLMCCVLAIFGICIFWVGYKDISVGRVITIVVLFISAGVCQFFVHKYKRMLAQASNSQEASNTTNSQQG